MSFEYIKNFRKNLALKNTKSKHYKRVIHINDNPYSPSVIVKYQPTGHWTDVVTIYAYFDVDKESKTVTCKEHKISGGSGGQDGSLDSIEATGHFIKALQNAQQVTQKLKDFTTDYEIAESK
jgi:hypothetical protein